MKTAGEDRSLCSVLVVTVIFGVCNPVKRRSHAQLRVTCPINPVTNPNLVCIHICHVTGHSGSGLHATKVVHKITVKEVKISP
jgi:hypothetical protein